MFLFDYFQFERFLANQRLFTAPPPRPARPLANIRPASASRERRKVSFQNGPPEAIDNLYDAPKPIKTSPAAGGKTSKWQPLSTTSHSPVGENDPFSLGDSEDERDNKPKDGSGADNDQVKKVTAEAMESDIASDSKDTSKKADD